MLKVWGDIIQFDPTLSEPDAVLSRYIRNKLNFSFDQPELSRIFTSEVLGGGHYLHKYWPQATANITGKENLIQGWIAQQKIRPLDARLFIMHIWAVTQYYADFAVQVKHMYGDFEGDNAAREHIIAEVTTLILNGCKKEKAHDPIFNERQDPHRKQSSGRYHGIAVPAAERRSLRHQGRLCIR